MVRINVRVDLSDSETNCKCNLSAYCVLISTDNTVLIRLQNQKDLNAIPNEMKVHWSVKLQAGSMQVLVHWILTFALVIAQTSRQWWTTVTYSTLETQKHQSFWRTFFLAVLWFLITVVVSALILKYCSCKLRPKYTVWSEHNRIEFLIVIEIREAHQVHVEYVYFQLQPHTV